LNGIIVNKRRVAEHRLADQDRVRIGVYELLYDAAGEPPLDIQTGSGVAAEISELIAAEGLAPAVSSDAIAQAGSPGAERGAQVGRLKKENKLLKLLLGFGKAFSSALTPDEILDRALELAFRMDGVERGFVMLRGEKAGFKPAVLRTRDEKLKAAPSSVVLSRKIIERVTTERLSLLIRNISEDPRFADSESLRLSGTRSAMCAPLLYKQDVFGILYVDCLSKPWAFNQEQLSVFTILAEQAAMSLENARAHEALSHEALKRQALERFLSEPIVEKILANPDHVRLGGENQTATILFTDIRGFTHLAESMEPPAVVALLNEFFTEMTEVIFEHGGTLDKYLGDGLMAVFGAPLTRPDDADRAVETAMELQHVLAQLNRAWQEQGQPQLQIGIGVTTGLVTAGNIGSDRRMDYTVIGDAVNLAQRLCAHAAGGQILISESTSCLLHAGLRREKLQPILVKGKEAPVETYQVVWKGETTNDEGGHEKGTGNRE